MWDKRQRFDNFSLFSLAVNAKVLTFAPAIAKKDGPVAQLD